MVAAADRTTGRKCVAFWLLSGGEVRSDFMGATFDGFVCKCAWRIGNSIPKVTDIEGSLIPIFSILKVLFALQLKIKHLYMIP